MNDIRNMTFYEFIIKGKKKLTNWEEHNKSYCHNLMKEGGDGSSLITEEHKPSG